MPNLIRTKIQIPPVPPNHITRPHLIEHLNLVHAPELVLASAPAGFGKSTIINAWVQQCEQAVAWFSLDSSDNDPARFWSYLLAALQSAGVNLDDGLTQTISAGSEAVATAIINELADRAESLKIVLDDYHLISERSIHNAIGLLLDHMPEGVTLVIITRADPPCALGRLRARGQMVELRAAQLRFTADEITTFLQTTMKLALAPNDISALSARTEGWPAGLQLAALALRAHRSPAAFVRDFAGSHHYIVEYLTEEVIRQQPDDVQRFLLETAHLDRLSALLCDAVTGRRDSQRILSHLRDNNLFLIALDPARTWYRYHHLFADVLRHRQRQHLTAGVIQDLHERASDWHQTVDQIPEAVEYALAGSHYQKAARLLEDNWHHIQHRGELGTIRRWLGALPDDLVTASAPLSMAYCWLHHLSGEAAAVEVRLTDVKRAWDQHAANGTVPDREAWIVIPSLTHTIAAIVELCNGRAQAAVEHAQQALDLVPDDPRVNRELLVGTATYRLAQAYRELDQYEESVAIMLDVLANLKRTGNTIGLVRGAYDTVQMYLALGQPDHALAVCEDMLEHLSQQGRRQSPLVGMIHAARAEVALYANDRNRAQAHLDDALTLAGSSRYPPLVERLQALQAQLVTLHPQATSLAEPLTDREMDVLRLLSEGHSNQEIAAALVITEDTVKRHNTHIFGKLDVSSRTQAVLRAQELGLL